MKDSIKREQRQAVLHFAERENSRATLKKKILMILALLCAVAQGAWAQDGWSVWDGSSSEQPYMEKKSDRPTGYIGSAANLVWLREHWSDETRFVEISNANPTYFTYNECNYVLNVDIDMGDWSWTPLGSYWNAYLHGTFNGNGHTIRINISGATSDRQGLFANIGDGTIENLHVIGNISCSNSQSVGGIAGWNKGTIRNCWVSADVSSNWTGSGYARIGGIAGENDGTIEYCCMTGNVTNYDDNVAGIAGDNDDGTLRNCVFYGILTRGTDSGLQNDNIYAGDSGTEDDCFDFFNQTQYNNASGNDMFRQAIRYPWAINISAMGNGTLQASAGGETDIPGWRHSETITLTNTTGKALHSFSLTDADGNNISYSGNPTSSLTFTMPRKDVNINAEFTADWPRQGSGTAESPYLITTADDWAEFVQSVYLGNTHSGKHVKLDADISVTRPVGGSETNSFQGTFDGGGHTLTFNRSGFKWNFMAPFRYVGGTCTIKNLRTAGSIQTTQQFASGLISYISSVGSTVNVENCISSMTLNSSLDYNSSNGGLIAAIANNCNVTVRGCAFTGSFTGSTSDNNGGIVSWVNDGTTLNITDCLFAPASISTELDGCNTWARGAGVSTLINSYYTQAYGTAQGARVYRITPGSHVTIGNAGAVGNSYDVSGLTFYATGFKYGDVLYAGNGDAVSLTLGSQPGFITSGYTASAGTLSGSGNPYTLTMPAGNVTISAASCSANALTTDGDGNYLINDEDDWDVFCANVELGNGFSGETVKLTGDISVSNMVGTSETNSFQGTFLGSGYTITAGITNNSGQGTAPFRYIKDATIKDLTVAGTIASNQRHIAGLVGFVYGSENRIEDCVVTATLGVSTDYAGGIVGHGLNSTTTIEGCVFAGTINVLGSNNPNVGVFLGWSDSGTPTLVNCLEAGTYNNVSKMHPMGLQKAAGTITNCYYVHPQAGSPSNACTVSGALQAVAATTAPTNLSGLVENYRLVKAYEHGILYGGKYYGIPAPAAISLANTGDNGTAISTNNGYVADVTLAGRTLYKDGAWNTICLPFNVTLEGSPLEGAVARPLTAASISGSTLNLTFGDAVSTLVAGTPYIIKWAADANNIENPVFSGVTISTDKHDYDNLASGDLRVRFIGTYKSTAFDGTDNTVLLLGAANTLYYPTDGAGLGAQRAYFKLGSGEALARKLTSFNIDFGDESTGIVTISKESGSEGVATGWYTLDGMKLSQKPTAKGIYVNNGRKVVVK